MDGRMIVRRFTEELEGTTDLERATQEAQVIEDNEIALAERRRVQHILEDLNPDSDFSAAEAACIALGRTCETFEEETRSIKPSRWGTQRKSAQTRANEMFQNAAVHDVEGLCDLVDNLDQTWQAQNGPVFRNFQRVCKTLHNHKSVFQVFPSQNTYASVLCGSLSLIVQASVNHDSIPEFLSKSVAELSEKAATCAQLVDIIRKKNLQERLADIYALLFVFYRDAMAWFLKSRTKKFLSSFNEELKGLFQEAMDKIQDRINELYRQADNVAHVKLEVLVRDVGDIRDELFRQRQNASSDVQVGREGLKMLWETMRVMYHTIESQNQRLGTLEEGRIDGRLPKERRLVDAGSTSGDPITGKELRAHSKAIQSVIVGDEGHAFFKEGKFWMVDALTLAKLKRWMVETPASRILWVSSPPTSSDSMTGARAAALSVVASSLQAKRPVISHFCRRPHSREIAGRMTAEEVGLMGLVYSLINQLQQFVRDDEEIELGRSTLHSLDGSKASWATSLEILDTLLCNTPQLSCCIIDGLNELEWSGGAVWCQELFVVLQNRGSKEQPLNLLITTMGQSRFLAHKISSKDRYLVSSIPQQVNLTRKQKR